MSTMRRVKSFLLILLALWLPLQTAAATVMPFCRHAVEQQLAQEAAAAMPVHCHEHAGMTHDDLTPGTDDQAAADSGCDSCEMCHLASAGYLLTAVADALPLPTNEAMVAGRFLASPSFIPDPLQEPPRRTN